MLSIHIDKFTCWGYHGIHAEETLLGNQFELSIQIDCSPNTLPITQLNQTIDYVEVVELIKKRMAIATPLLETIASDIGLAIFKKYNNALKVAISIHKIHPPVEQWKGKLGIQLILDRNHLKIQS